jgi:thymidylate synthase (FAD)
MKISKQQVDLIDYMGSDLSVVNAARVSFNKESNYIFDTDHNTKSVNRYLEEKDVKLINYLAKHGHWSPFGHAFLSFRIKAPIFVARQLVKHQVGLCWNEVSRRYVDDEPEFYFPEVWHKRPDASIKQGSSVETVDMSNSDYFVHSVETALQAYDALLFMGIAPEEARMVLPLNTMTEWIWSGSLQAFARVCNLRLDSHAQSATREVALMINDQVPREFEHSWKALIN